MSSNFDFLQTQNVYTLNTEHTSRLIKYNYKNNYHMHVYILLQYTLLLICFTQVPDSILSTILDKIILQTRKHICTNKCSCVYTMHAHTHAHTRIYISNLCNNYLQTHLMATFFSKMNFTFIYYSNN